MTGHSLCGWRPSLLLSDSTNIFLETVIILPTIQIVVEILLKILKGKNRLSDLHRIRADTILI